MVTVVFGSRGITDFKVIEEALELADVSITKLIHGDARGVDRIAGKILGETLPVVRMPAQWGTYGRSAGFRRNERMAQEAEIGIAIWDGISAGTAHMIRTMTKLNKPVFVYNASTGLNYWCNEKEKK